MKKLNIAYVASEVTPYSKTGGLADVAGALPQELASLKNRVALFSPRYSSVDRKKYDLVDVPGLGVAIGSSRRQGIQVRAAEAK